ncbi:poly(A) RNA polymerase, mitochondrial-like isoform X2 [Dreissena polymorpha]|uniref:poly(A) RNA polymerase, mitochondrial-like isoform X2 n=1 Tax=Dreissena polymorpha TaxID=45954 RepID=UPI002264844D|nr:poly(A) RNA polymerase, mitochondrial-like isoform X2 [Dreissena polymorpha]
MAGAMALSHARIILVFRSCCKLYMNQIHIGKHMFRPKQWTKTGLVVQAHPKIHQGQTDSSKEPGESTALNKDVLSGHLTSNKGRAPDFTSYRDFIKHYTQIANASVLVKIDSQHSIDAVYKELSKKIELKNYSEVQLSGEQSTKIYLVEVVDENKLNKFAPLAEQRIIYRVGESTPHLDLGPVKASEEEKNSLPKKLGQCKNVEDQLQLLYQTVSLPESSLRFHFFASKFVERVLRFNSHLKHAVVECFGSSPSGTALRRSADLDLAVFVPASSNVKPALSNVKPVSSKQLRKIVKRRLRKTPFAKKKSPHVRSSIAHMDSELLNLPLDISVNNKSGVLMSNMFFLLGKLHASFLPLVVFLKHWALVNDLAQGYKYVSSYQLSMLLISHLQQLRQLPPLKDLYETKFEPGSASGDFDSLEKIRFKPLPTISKNWQDSTSMFDILCSFFKYYGEFDFRSHVIDVHNGVTVSQTHTFFICVCNPHKELHNVCMYVTQDGLERLQNLCKLSHMALTQNKLVIQDKHWGIQTLLPLLNTEVNLPVHSPVENSKAIKN